MATATDTQTVDPSKGARIPVKIGKELLQEDSSPRKRPRIGVQYNHWPEALSPGKGTITSASGDSDSRYSLKVEGKESEIYEYEGVQRPSTSAALFYNPVDKTFTLDKVDTEFLFNLRSTPSQSNPATLVARYSQLDTGTESGPQNGDDLFDESQIDDLSNKEEAPPDPSNPYDYRHFINQSPPPAPSAISSPVPNHVHITSSPALSAISPASFSSKPAKSTKKQRSNHEHPRYLSPIPTREVAEDEDEENTGLDPDDLIIDMGDEPNQKPWRRDLGVLNEGRNSGPISLRSAASSMSPSIRGESDGEREDHVADEDEDVEEIDLGAADNGQTATQEDAATPGNGWDDNEDELEAELELALGDQAEEEDIDHEAGGVALNGEPAAITNGAFYERRKASVVVESSSESEEE